MKGDEAGIRVIEKKSRKTDDKGRTEFWYQQRDRKIERKGYTYREQMVALRCVVTS